MAAAQGACGAHQRAGTASLQRRRRARPAAAAPAPAVAAARGRVLAPASARARARRAAARAGRGQDAWDDEGYQGGGVGQSERELERSARRYEAAGGSRRAAAPQRQPGARRGERGGGAGPPPPRGAPWEGIGGGGGGGGGNGPRGPGGGGGPRSLFPTVAAAFLFGIGAGVSIDSAINLDPNNIATREVIDQMAPNKDICLENGYSAMVMDTRVFLSLNPFNVYIGQPEVKPGCVMRQANWRVLENRNLLSSREVSQCQQTKSTFGYVGDINGSPEVSCIYHSEDAENQFLRDPTKALMGDGVQPQRTRLPSETNSPLNSYQPPE